MCVQVNINNSSPHENVRFTYLVEEEGGGGIYIYCYRLTNFFFFRMNEFKFKFINY